MATPNPPTMRAAVLHGTRDVRITDIPYPSIPPGHVAIATKFCGICGSDLHLFYVDEMFKSIEQPHKLTGAAPPIPLGHEFAGQVMEVGEGCKSLLARGDKVAILPVLSDGTCDACEQGATNACSRMGFVGYHWQSSAGLSEVAVVPEELVFRLPDGVDYDIGALVEPLAVAWHGVAMAGSLSASSKALIVGAGPVGCAVVLCLRAQGVRNIIVCEPSEPRRKRALQMGASHAVDPRASDAIAEVQSLTDGAGVDAAFECAGVDQTLNTAVQSLRPKGTAVIVALWSRPAQLGMMKPLLRENTIRFSMSYTKEDFRAVIEAIGNGGLAPHQMITKKIRLQDLVVEGFEALHQRDTTECKILVDMSIL